MRPLIKILSENNYGRPSIATIPIDQIVWFDEPLADRSAGGTYAWPENTGGSVHLLDGNCLWVPLEQWPTVRAELVKKMTGPMTPKEQAEQRINFAYGNVALHNPEVTREDVERAAEELKATSA